MLKAGIIGCSGIAGVNSKNPKNRLDYNHLSGILYSEKVKLAGIADLSKDRRELFMSNWGESFPDTNCYASAQELLQREELDIVDVCVRGTAHFPVVMEVLKTNPKLIFLEKAPTCSLKEMDIMIDEANKRRIPIIVSYSRHWSPSIKKMEQLIGDGLVGEVKTVIGYCEGWVFSMGSHQTDMICQFAGYNPKTVLAKGIVKNATDQSMKWHTIDNIPEGYEPEPHIDSMIIEFENGVMGVHVGAPTEHGKVYCDIFGTEGYARVPFNNGPATDTRCISVFNRKGEQRDISSLDIPEADNVFSVAYNQMADYLNGGPLPDCSIDKWQAVHEIGFAAIESINENRVIELPNKNRNRNIFIL